MTAGGADSEVFREAPDGPTTPVEQARALLWSQLDDLSDQAKAQTCQSVAEAIEDLIDAKLKEKEQACPQSE